MDHRAGSGAVPGYLCVVARTQVREPFELGGLAQRRYWEELLVAARAAPDNTGAAEVDYEIHGNTLPHLHCHLYPRFPGDPFSGRPIDAAARLFHRSLEEINA